MRLLLAVLLVPSLAHADAVVLKNGERIVGRVLTETPTEVTMSSGGITWTYKREKIATLTRDEGEASQEHFEAIQRNRKARRNARVASDRMANQRSREAARRRDFAKRNEASHQEPPPTPPPDSAPSDSAPSDPPPSDSPPP